MTWELLDLLETRPAESPRRPAKRRRNPTHARLLAAARDREIVVFGGQGKSIGESVRLAGKRLGIDLEWIPVEASQWNAQSQRLASRLRRGKVAGLVLVNGIVGHKQLVPVVDGAKAGGVPFVLAGRAGSAQLTRAFEELESML